MKPIKFFVFILLFPLLFTGPLFAQIHTWVDEDGVRHYSDSPVVNPEKDVKVLEEVEPPPDPPKQHQQKNDNWREQMEKRKAEEAKKQKEQRREKQAAERNKKIKNAYDTLIKLKNLVSKDDVDWDKYERLLADAKQTLDAFSGNAKKNRKITALTEAYESYAVVPELKRLAMNDQEEMVIARIKKINKKLGTKAPTYNYYKARRAFWNHAADKLKTVTP